mgnify:CR=1
LEKKNAEIRNKLSKTADKLLTLESSKVKSEKELKSQLSALKEEKVSIQDKLRLEIAELIETKNELKALLNKEKSD